eukprot:jgi/Bigna1/69988/fgenesh1_pg.10_\
MTTFSPRWALASLLMALLCTVADAVVASKALSPAPFSRAISSRVRRDSLSSWNGLQLPSNRAPSREANLYTITPTRKTHTYADPKKDSPQGLQIDPDAYSDYSHAPQVEFKDTLQYKIGNGAIDVALVALCVYKALQSARAVPETWSGMYAPGRSLSKVYKYREQFLEDLGEETMRPKDDEYLPLARILRVKKE